MGRPLVVAYDVGTSGVKAVVMDADGAVLASAGRDYGLTTPASGWVEQDVEGILERLGEAGREVLATAAVDPTDVAGVAVTAQMFNVVPLDAAGRPIAPMLSWLDQRAAPQAAELASEVPGDAQYELFDAVLTAKDVVPRIRWLADERPEVLARATWLVDCKEAVVAGLTGEVVTDPAGATAFRLMDTRRGTWSAERCAAAGVPIDRLAPIRPATAIAGPLTKAAAALTGLPDGVPVVVGAGDVPASQVGAGAVGPGDTHLSLGTAVYFGITTDAPLSDPARRLGVIAHADPGRWILWLEIATGGGALEWLRRLLGDLPGSGQPDHETIERLVVEAEDGMGDLLFAPWLTGERVPVFDDAVRGAFVGLSLSHTRGHLIRAVMEGVASQIAWAHEYGVAYGVSPGTVRAVGGGSIGDVWTELIATALHRPIEVVAAPQEAGARGAAACARVALGLVDDFAAAARSVRIARVVTPDPAAVAAAASRGERLRTLYDAIAPLHRAPAAPRRAVVA